MNVDKPIKSIKFKSEIRETIKSGMEFVFGEEYDIYIPNNIMGSYARMEDLTPDVNPVTAACQKAALENIFLQLNILDKCT